MKQGAAKKNSGLPTAEANANLRVNSMESVISGLEQLRRQVQAIGLPKVTTCLDYAYYEALGALRESRDNPRDDGESLS